MIKTESVAATETTKSFAVVLTCIVSESELDDLQDFFAEQNLAYAEKSDDFTWLGDAYLETYSTADSRNCQFDSLLPVPHTTKELAVAYAQDMINNSECVSKRFFTLVVCDADKIDSILKSSPFTPGEWI